MMATMNKTLPPFFSVGATVVVVVGFTVVGAAVFDESVEPGPDDEVVSDDVESDSPDPASLVLSDPPVVSLVVSLVFSVLLVVPVVVALLSEFVAFVDGRVVFP